MQVVFLGDSLHDMSNPIVLGNLKRKKEENYHSGRPANIFTQYAGRYKTKQKKKKKKKKKKHFYWIYDFSVHRSLLRKLSGRFT